jgi:1-acyl-sn-glycerol-3-phosphate acyltransferase
MDRTVLLLRAKRLAQTATGFAYFGAGGLLLSHVILPLADRNGDRWERARRCQRIVRRGLQHYLRVVKWLQVGTMETDAFAAAMPDEPCVIIANHPTLLDVTAFLAAGDGICVVAKGSLFRGPYLGNLLRRCGHIDAGEASVGDGAAVMSAAIDRLNEGFSVLVFAEGTRSPEGGMHPLQRGAFELAARAGVPVLPVFMQCDPPALMKGIPWYRSIPYQPFRLRLTPLDLMPCAPSDGRALRKSIQARLLERVVAWHDERRRAPGAEAPQR